MCQNKFKQFLLEMHDKIIHNLKIRLGLTGHSMIPIRSNDYLPTPWMVYLTLKDRYHHFENHCPSVELHDEDHYINLTSFLLLFSKLYELLL